MPYGIDFLEKSINQAKVKIFPKFKNNFIYGNVLDITYKNKFDYLITNPEYVSPNDFVKFFEKCKTALTENCILIFLIAPDVYSRIKNTSYTKVLKVKKVKWIKHRNIVCCYIKNN